MCKICKTPRHEYQVKETCNTAILHTFSFTEWYTELYKPSLRYNLIGLSSVWSPWRINSNNHCQTGEILILNYYYYYYYYNINNRFYCILSSVKYIWVLHSPKARTRNGLGFDPSWVLHELGPYYSIIWIVFTVARSRVRSQMVPGFDSSWVMGSIPDRSWVWTQLGPEFDHWWVQKYLVQRKTAYRTKANIQHIYSYIF